MLPELTDARFKRAVTTIRRTYRGVLSEQIDAVEAELEAQIGGFLPLSSRTKRLANGNRTGEDELVAMLREATDHGHYHLPHYRVLTRSGGCAIDELTSSGLMRDMDPEIVVKAIANRIEFARIRRGRGGRYGAIRWGFSTEVMAEIGAESCGEFSGAAEMSDQFAHAMELKLATKRLRRLVRVALFRYDRSVQRCFRRAYAEMVADQAEDDEYREIFSDGEQAVLNLIVGGRLSWRKLAAQKLGLASQPHRLFAPKPVAVRPPISLVRHVSVAAPLAA